MQLRQRLHKVLSSKLPCEEPWVGGYTLEQAAHSCPLPCLPHCAE